LRRGIDTLEHALAAATALRASRFHDGGDVFVVREPEGTIVELVEVDLPAGTDSLSAAPPSSAPPPSDVPPSTEALQAEPPPAAPPDSEPPRAAGEWVVEPHVQARLDALAAQLEQAHLAIARARAARERFERAYAEAGRALRIHDGYGVEAAEAINAYRARLDATRDLSVRTVASCERSASLIAERLAAARRSRPL